MGVKVVVLCGGGCGNNVDVMVPLTLKTDREGYSKGRYDIRENDIIESVEAAHWRTKPKDPYGERYCPSCCGAV